MEKKKLVVSKEELQKTVDRLEVKVQEMEQQDEWRRRQLSELLESYDYYQNIGMTYRQDRAVKVQSWMGIAFLIGELKADADYSMCIQAREDLKREVEGLKERLQQIEHLEAK